MSSCGKKTFVWAREVAKDLITLYEGQPTLYVTKLKEYKNKNKRAEAILFMRNELLKKYPVICENLTEEDVVKKIHVLRTQYLKELAILKKFLSSGASTDAYTPKLWCFDLLGFLREEDPVRESESNLTLESTQYDSEESEVIFEGEIDEFGCLNSEVVTLKPSTSATATTSTTPTPENHFSSNFNNNSGKRKSNTPAITALLNSAVKSLEEHSKRKKGEDDEFDVFGRTVAVELRKVTDTSAVRISKKNIFSQILDAQY